MALTSPLWEAIRDKVAGEYPDKPLRDAYVTPSGWIIGPYNVLCDVAHDIAPGAADWKKYENEGGKVGRRKTDTPPFVVGHLPGFRKKIVGMAPAFVAQSVLDQREDPLARSGPFRGRDQYGPMDAYYKVKGLEAHHIVEKSIIGKLGLNGSNPTNDLADIRAPCVLVMAELHRRKFTPGVGSARDAYSAGLGGTLASSMLKTLFGQLYNDGEFSELKAIAGVIIDEVKRLKGG
jgi:hypothetical protein